MYQFRLNLQLGVPKKVPVLVTLHTYKSQPGHINRMLYLLITSGMVCFTPWLVVSIASAEP